MQISWHSYKVDISTFNFGGKIAMKHTWSLFSTVCVLPKIGLQKDDKTIKYFPEAETDHLNIPSKVSLHKIHL